MKLLLVLVALGVVGGVNAEHKDDHTENHIRPEDGEDDDNDNDDDDFTEGGHGEDDGDDDDGEGVFGDDDDDDHTKRDHGEHEHGEHETEDEDEDSGDGSIFSPYKRCPSPSSLKECPKLFYVVPANCTVGDPKDWCQGERHRCCPMESEGGNEGCCLRVRTEGSSRMDMGQGMMGMRRRMGLLSRIGLRSPSRKRMTMDDDSMAMRPRFGLVRGLARRVRQEMGVSDADMRAAAGRITHAVGHHAQMIMSNLEPQVRAALSSLEPQMKAALGNMDPQMLTALQNFEPQARAVLEHLGPRLRAVVENFPNLISDGVEKMAHNMGNVQE